MYLKQFFPKDSELCVTEFGHSIVKNKKSVGPWSREIYILHFIIKGHCAFSGFDVEAGQAFFISKGLRHSFTVSDDYEHYWIGFNGNGVEKIFKAFGLECNLHQLFYVENDEFARNIFYSAEKHLKDSSENSTESMVFAALAAMLPLLKKEKTSIMPKGINYAEKVQRFIQTNYVYPIQMSEIAKEIHISEKYMYRLFRNRFGLSPQKFLLKTRMEAAKKNLQTTDSSVKETAYSVGYKPVPSFSKAFLNYWGTNPSSLK